MGPTDRLKELQKMAGLPVGTPGESGSGLGSSAQLRPAQVSSHFRSSKDANKIPGILSFSRPKEKRSISIRNQEDLKARVNTAQDLVDSICENTRVLRELHSKALLSTQYTAEHRSEMDVRVEDTQNAYTGVCSTIKELQRLRQDGGSAAFRRMCEVQSSGLRVSLTRAMSEHYRERERYAGRLRELTTKAYRLVSNESRDSLEIDRLLEEGKVCAFVDNVSTPAKSIGLVPRFKLPKPSFSEYQNAEQEELLMVLKDATDRHNDLLAVEKSISEIRDLFVKMGDLITMQGSTINRIEEQMGSAEENTASGAVELKKANKNKTKIRKKKWIIIICTTVVLFGLLGLTLILILG